MQQWEWGLWKCIQIHICGWEHVRFMVGFFYSDVLRQAAAVPLASLKGLQNWINQTCFFYWYLETNGNPATGRGQLSFTQLEIPVLFSVCSESWATGQTIACWPSVVTSTFPVEGYPAHWGLRDLVPVFVGIFCNLEHPDLEVKEWKNIDLGFQAERFYIHLSSLGPK